MFKPIKMKNIKDIKKMSRKQMKIKVKAKN